MVRINQIGGGPGKIRLEIFVLVSRFFLMGVFRVILCILLNIKLESLSNPIVLIV